ncbi:D-alanyl-D-alanine carboxypeptidase (penicillin-binding protein 5/6) [Saccharopolyspora lacisalsi]|uniref:D-alanyl-D-alanine carboxypeptidase (Penicillin-binding protein 5/6) n=1 Tax=Halosaccharopolyspora lacisalsi TaxID=1000566 RepID=A0A839DVC6_9PSEU|nr:D-alanyl-D-alanine carboxypeptidase (penicillin-binding protein 5/6) [Halosaccharopolyspora lacisalsi]
MPGKKAAAVVCAALVALVPGAVTAPATTAPPASTCPNATLPPPPVDSSEVPPPGIPSPQPLPVPEQPVGGESLGRCGVVTPPGEPVPERVGSTTWMVAELGSSDVLAAKNPHGRHRPASIIKVLTALVTIRELELTDTLTAAPADAAVEGSKVGLVPGVTYTVDQILAGLIMQSGNDAAHALTRALGGERATLDRMNELAHRLGALDTRAATSSGLDGPGMTTSAYDMALIFRAALRQPAFARIATTRVTTLPTPPGEAPMKVYSDNDVLTTYPGAIGAKSGFTDDARHTYIAAAERDGRRLVAVLMRGEYRPVDLDVQAKALLNYGFRLTGTEPIGRLVEPRPQPTASSTGVEHAAGVEDGSASPVESSADRPRPHTSLFGNVGGPLALLLAAGVVAFGVVALRQRRARLASVARRDSLGPPDDHP